MRTLLPRLRAELRQRRHHKAFRVAPPEDAPLLAELGRLLDQVSTQEEPELDDKALAGAATSLWRARRKLAQDGDGRYTKPASRYLDLCRSALADIGLVVQDHDGDSYHPGRRLEVLAFEDDPDAEHDRVLRTVQPSIYFRGRHIQVGQVVVGSPTVKESNA
jgi:hypothetical protein